MVPSRPPSESARARRRPPTRTRDRARLLTAVLGCVLVGAGLVSASRAGTGSGVAATTAVAPPPDSPAALDVPASACRALDALAEATARALVGGWGQGDDPVAGGWSMVEADVAIVAGAGHPDLPADLHRWSAALDAIATAGLPTVPEAPGAPAAGPDGGDADPPL